MDKLTGERYNREHPLPNEIANMPLEETFCHYCGVSHLMYHEFEMLQRKISKLENQLQQSPQRDKSDLESAQLVLKHHKLEDQLNLRNIELKKTREDFATVENISHQKFVRINKRLRNLLFAVEEIRKYGQFCSVVVKNTGLFGGSRVEWGGLPQLAVDRIERINEKIALVANLQTKYSEKISGKLNQLKIFNKELCDTNEKLLWRLGELGDSLTCEVERRKAEFEKEIKLLRLENQILREKEKDRTEILENETTRLSSLNEDLVGLLNQKENETKSLQSPHYLNLGEIDDIKLKLCHVNEETAKISLQKEICCKNMEDSFYKSLTQMREESDKKVEDISRSHQTEIEDLKAKLEAERRENQRLNDSICFQPKFAGNEQIVDELQRNEGKLKKEIWVLRERVRECEDVVRRECEERKGLIETIETLKSDKVNKKPKKVDENRRIRALLSIASKNK